MTKKIGHYQTIALVSDMSDLRVKTDQEFTKEALAVAMEFTLAADDAEVMRFVRARK